MRFLTRIVNMLPHTIAGLLLLFCGCVSETSQLDDLRPVCFDTEVLPIFLEGCATGNCHDATAAGGYRLDSHEGILPGVRPGDALSSPVYRTVISTGTDHMPPDGSLPVEERMYIRVWIDQGAEKVICDVQDTLPPPDSTWTSPVVCFRRDILPVFQSRCGVTGCHDPFSRVEDYDFTTYEGILEAVSPGNPSGSKIYQVITEDEPWDIMPPPPADPLSGEETDSIYRWILLGAADEECGDLCDSVDVTYGTHIAPFITSYCLGCHSSDTPGNQVLLGSYDDVVARVNEGFIPAVLKREAGVAPMPPNLVVSDCQVRIFEIWIEQGLPE